MKYKVLELLKVDGDFATLKVRTIDDGGTEKIIEVDVDLSAQWLNHAIEEAIQSHIRRSRNVERIDELISRGEREAQ